MPLVILTMTGWRRTMNLHISTEHNSQLVEIKKHLSRLHMITVITVITVIPSVHQQGVSSHLNCLGSADEPILLSTSNEQIYFPKPRALQGLSQRFLEVNSIHHWTPVLEWATYSQQLCWQKKSKNRTVNLAYPLNTILFMLSSTDLIPFK